MAARRKESQFLISRGLPTRLASDTKHHHSGPMSRLDKNLASLKSAKIARKLQKNPNEDLGRLLHDSQADEESMEVFARFCHGLEISLSTENVVRVACLAHYLEMTDNHCSNNLLSQAFMFFEQNIINSWSNSIKALKSAEKCVFKQAEELGLVKYCVETLILKALDDPRLLGDPLIMNEESNDDDYEKPYKKPNTRRKLEWKSQDQEDLTSLPLRLYAPIVHSMIQRQLSLQYLSANLCKYAETWLFSQESHLDVLHQKKIIEALVMLLPPQTGGLIPCTFLCKMLRFAMAVDASLDCRDGLEERIGMQLAEASTKDLLIHCPGYANDGVYDTECLRRILKHFYRNYTDSDPISLTLVADLMEDLLADMAADKDLKKNTFIAVAEFSMAASEASKNGSSNGIYKALNIYLDKHRHLTDSEKEDLCKILDISKLSAEAVQHAAMNERLPLRVVVQALFASQLKIRDAVPKALAEGGGGGGEEVMRTEMVKMGSKVSELERECGVMRREIERGGIGKKEKKGSVWREMKRKFGCMTSMHDCDCHVNKKMKMKMKKKMKVHPRLL